jgi:hypothetical protein
MSPTLVDGNSAAHTCAAQIQEQPEPRASAHPAGEKPMTSWITRDEPTSRVVAEGWREFAQTLLPTIAETGHVPTQVAFYSGAMYLLHVVQPAIAGGSDEAVSLAFKLLEAELSELADARTLDSH